MQLVGEISRCHWCIDYARSLGGPDTIEVLRVGGSPPIQLPDAERRAALRQEATQTPVVSDETFAGCAIPERQIVS
jgi:hypothetical protein